MTSRTTRPRGRTPGLVAALTALTLLLALPLPGIAGPGGKGGGDYKHFGELTKETEHLTGFWDIHRDGDDLYLEIPLERLGEPFLLIESISSGIGMRGLLGGMPTHFFEARMLHFERHGDRVLVVETSPRFQAPEGTPAARAVDLSYGASVLASLKVESERHEGDQPGVVPEEPEEEAKEADATEESGDAGMVPGEDGATDDEADSTAAGEDQEAETPEAAPEAEDAEEAADEEPETPVISIVVNFKDVVMSDMPNLGLALGESFKNGFSLDASRSTLDLVKVFPENAEFGTSMVFKSSGKASIPTVPDSRFVTLGMRYSFSKLPEEPMMPRLADERLGYFMTVHKDFSRDEGNSFFVRYINRWRLEKKNPNREVSEPVEPIVYYVENTIPEEYRKYVKQGIELWQPAFEAAGFKNAIIAKDQPDDPDWSAEDVRYSTIRWITSHQPSFGAIGPSRVDPRTGEILDADILFEANMLLGFRSTYRTYGAEAAPAPGGSGLPWLADIEAQIAAWDDPATTPEELSGLHCSLGHGFTQSGVFLQAFLAMRGDIDLGDPVPEELVGEAVRWVTAHEVGHTLGLMHNFKSSHSVPLDKLNDRDYVRKHGLTGSVMDYPATNVARDGTRQGYYWSPAVGTYDHWAITFGYAPVKGARKPEDETAFLNRIASRNADPLLDFGNDVDSYPIGAVDPRINTFDLSADPLGFFEERSLLLEEVWDDVMTRVPEGESWNRLTDVYGSLLGQHANMMFLAAKYVGGKYQSRAYKGDPNAPLPFQPVETDRQRRALRLLADRCFSPEPFLMGGDFYNRLGADRWAHWGNSTFYSGRVDFPVHQVMLAIQAPALARLMHPMTLAKVLDGELGSQDPLTLVELFETLDGAIWAELRDPSATAIPSFRRGLQRLWLDRVIDVSLSQGSGTPADAKAVARMTLTDLQADLDAALAGGASLDGYTRAHLMDSRARVSRALDAGYEAELMQRMN